MWPDNRPAQWPSGCQRWVTIQYVDWYVMGERRRVGETEAKRPLAKPDIDGRAVEWISKMEWECDDWINLARVMYKCRVYVNTVMVHVNTVMVHVNTVMVHVSTVMVHVNTVMVP